MISALLDDIFLRIKTTTGDTVDSSQLRSLLHSALQKADIVSRDEFDAQTAVLHRTRERVKELEQKLSDIEKQLENKAD